MFSCSPLDTKQNKPTPPTQQPCRTKKSRLKTAYPTAVRYDTAGPGLRFKVQTTRQDTREAVRIILLIFNE